MTEDTMESEVIHAEPVNALEAMGRAEVDIQIRTAKQYPRSIAQVRKRILDLATCDQETAEQCFYALPRDGKVIEGPSVRLAEIVGSCYGNIKSAARVIEETDKYVVCQGAAIDLENNFSVSTEVRRRIVNKYGRRYSDDMIITTSNAGNSIAFRNAIFKVVPRAFYKSIEDEIRKIGMGGERALGERQKAASAWFKGQGIDERNMLALINKYADAQKFPEVQGLADIGIEHIQFLLGIKTAISEGTTTVDELLSEIGGEANLSERAKSHADKAKEAAKQAKSKNRKAEAAKAAAASEPAPDELGGLTEEQKTWMAGAMKTFPDELRQVLEAHGVAEDGPFPADKFGSIKSALNEMIE